MIGTESPQHGINIKIAAGNIAKMMQNVNTDTTQNENQLMYDLLNVSMVTLINGED